MTERPYIKDNLLEDLDARTLYDPEYGQYFTSLKEIKDRLNEMDPTKDNPIELVHLNMRAQELINTAGGSTFNLSHTLGKEIEMAINAMKMETRIEFFKRALLLTKIDF